MPTRIWSMMATVAMMVTLACGCGSNRSASDPIAPAGAIIEATQPDRPASYDSCPRIELQLADQWHLIDRQLANLGSGVLGRSLTFERRNGEGVAQQIEVSTGVEVLGAYEDLDFASTAVDVGSVPAEMFRAGAFGTRDELVVVSWDHPDLDVPCSRYTVVGTNVDGTEVLAIAHKVMDLAVGNDATDGRRDVNGS